jgi:transcriptional regulator with XRE-family HTH domain
VNSENGNLKVGARLRWARLSKGLRMRDLAQAVGCDESMISKIEAGKVMP